MPRALPVHALAWTSHRLGTRLAPELAISECVHVSAHLQLIANPTPYHAVTADDSDVRRLLGAINEDRLAGIWRMLVLRLLPVEELLALEWSSVHVHSGRVVVRAPEGHGSHGSSCFRAVVALDHSTTAALARLRRWRAETRLALGPAWCAGNRVAVHGDGSPMTRTELAESFSGFAAAALLPDLRLEDFELAPEPF